MNKCDVESKAAKQAGPGLLILSVTLLLLAGCESGGQYKTKYYHTTTQDGVTLALRRYQPEVVDREKNPVILCHGLSYNLLFWDLHESVSLPRYLASQGYDVWSLSLRGATPSSQPLNSAMRRLARFNLDPMLLSTLQARLQTVTLTNWSVDDHIQYDVPAALAFVREQTDMGQVHWVGHSMGGMVMMAYLGQADAAETGQVKTFVGIGVPMVAFHPLSDPYQFLLDQQATLAVGSQVVGSSAPAAVGVVAGDLGTPMDKLFYNGDNVDGSVLRALFYQAEEEISPGQFEQLMSMVRSERFTSLDGEVDYVAGLKRVMRPTYLLAGTVDNMATVAAVKFVHREVPGEPKQYKMFGRVNGHRSNYGHDDLVIGRHAKEEIYPTILEWLDDFPAGYGGKAMLLRPRGEPEPTKPNGMNGPGNGQ
jgi:pimeloyl-ACP methyl ester carboxylesterase